jgi:hypothetical protein
VSIGTRCVCGMSYECDVMVVGGRELFLQEHRERGRTS